MTSPPRAILSPNGVAERMFSQALSGHPLGGQRLSLLAKVGAALSTRAPERTDDHLAVIEGVVEVAAE